MIDQLWKLGKVAVPAIAFWEVGLPQAHGRLQLPSSVREWRDAVLAAGAIELPLDGTVAMRAINKLRLANPRHGFFLLLRPEDRIGGAPDQ